MRHAVLHRNQLVSLITLAALGLTPQAADAQQPPPPPGPVAPPYEEYGAPGAHEFVSGYDNPMRPRNESEFIFGVPIWFTSKDGVVDPGVSFEGRFARRFGFIAPEVTLGWQINWIDEEQLPSGLQNSNITIDTLFFSLGARFYPAPRAQVVYPFISGAVDFDFWHITGDDDLVCGYYYCTTVADYEFSLGLSSRVGVAFKANPVLQFELGAKIGMTFPMGPIDETEAWVTPFLGFTTVM